MASEFLCPRSPREWRFTWEAMGNMPIIRLFLFNSNIKPVNQCKNLEVSLNCEEFLLLVSWTEEIDDPNSGSVDFSLRVPTPRVLVDPGSPVDFRAREDHFEVKLVLLLPVDHPVLANFGSVLNLSEEDTGSENVSSDRLQTLSLDSDLKRLSSLEGAHFYCKSCLMKLTKKPLRSFMEMPSVNWSEVADNWFGTCCCSFGGISEKLVTNYANSYICAEGVCLLDATSVIICKEDLVDCFLFNSDGGRRYNDEPDLVSKGNLTKNQSEREFKIDGNASCETLKEENCAANFGNEIIEKESINTTLLCTSSLLSDFSRNAAPAHGFSAHEQNNFCDDMSRDLLNHDGRGCSQVASETYSEDLVAYQKSLLNGFLGNVFMVRSSNLSKDVEWIEFTCTQCSSLLGAYPCGHDGYAPLDGGVRLFKCYISTALPIGGSDDIFRMHTLRSMFTNQLLESATDELSFRTVVRDLRTKSPMLQVVLLNPNAWCCTGYCLGTKIIRGPASKIALHPVAKVLFSDCSNATETQLRMLEEWITKNQADEVYMLMHQIRELIKSLKAAHKILPVSCSYLQGMLLSSMER